MKPIRSKQPGPWGRLLDTCSVGLLAMLCGLSAAADPLPERSSTFDTDADAWGATSGGTLAWQGSSGNPGGYLQGSSANVTWHFTSPPAWAGQWSHYKVIKFDLALVNRQYADAARNNIVVIHGANGTDLTWSGFSPEFNWTHFEVPLVPAAFGVDQATFDAVLLDVAELRILGEYTSRAEQAGLDNVILTNQAAPRLENALISTFANGTEGWRPVDDVTLVHDTGVFDGNTGGKLRGDDWADGRMYWFASPLAWAGDWSAFRRLTFAMTLKSGSPAINGNNLRIIGANGQELIANVGMPYAGSWRYYALELTPALFGVEQAFFDAVMAHVIEMRICGEYVSGGESELLDNVIVSGADLRFPLVENDLAANFDADVEGWTVISGTASWRASGGNPGGFLRGVDGGGGIWYYVSPDTWAGDWSLLKQLRFQWKYLSGAYAAGTIDSVHIRAFDGRELVSSAYVPGQAWSPYTVDLSPATFGVDRATFESILRNVQKLWIRGESNGTGADDAGLDNVVVSLSDAPVIPPERFAGFDSGSEGWWAPVGGVSMSWQGSGGNPDGYLLGIEGGGERWGFGSPEAWCGDWRFYQTLSFDYRIVSGSYSFGAPDFVLIQGSNGQTMRAGITQPANSWLTYQVPLTPTAFGVDAVTFDAILRNVAYMILYAETVSNHDEEAIDNVRLSQAAVSSYEAWRAIHWPGPERFDDAISGPAADPDGDGFPNQAEFITGSGPNAPHEFFAAALAPATGTPDFVVSWLSNLGTNYQVESSEDLVRWQPLGPLHAGSGGVLTQPCPSAAAGHAFFRVMATR